MKVLSSIFLIVLILCSIHYIKPLGSSLKSSHSFDFEEMESALIQTGFKNTLKDKLNMNMKRHNMMKRDL
jgi:hypothetical protein